MKTEVKWTSSQREAIETDHPLVLVLAGPGSGKTKTTVDRVLRLFENGQRIERIAAITFTNAGARELESRIQSHYMHADQVDRPQVTRLGFSGTLHSFCLKILREHGGFLGYGARLSVISPESATDLLASKAQTLGCKSPLKDLLALKAKGRPPRGGRLSVDETVVATYYDELREAGIVDFDVILSEAAELLRSSEACAAVSAEFDHLLVDEFQDAASIDHSIYAALRIPNKFFVGDPDQQIYGFRGAWLEGILALARNAACQVIKLETNFRSHEEICFAAQRLIEHNRDRVAKRTISAKGAGGAVEVLPPFETEGAEIGGVAARIKHELWDDGEDASLQMSIAVLARTNSIAAAHAQTLAACGIPVVAREKSDIPADWIFARSVVELLVNPDNDTLAEFYLSALYAKRGATPKEAREAAHAARRAANNASKSLNAATLHLERARSAAGVVARLEAMNVSRESRMLAAERLRDLPGDASALDLALAIGATRDSSKEPAGDGVHVLTIHGAKGREFDAVFVVGFEENVIPGRAARIRGDDAARDRAIEEERRLAYVAVTRARKHLYVTSSKSRPTPWGEIVASAPSRFLAELSGKLSTTA